MGNVYNQGIGTLARKLQDGGEAGFPSERQRKSWEDRTELLEQENIKQQDSGGLMSFLNKITPDVSRLGGQYMPPTIEAAKDSTDFQKQLFLGGPLEAAQNITKTVGLEKLSENIPQIERGDTLTDDLARGAGQFLLPFAGATKLVGGFAAGAKGVLQAEALGLAVSQFVFDPSDEKVSDLIDASISSDTSNPLLSAIKSTASALKVNPGDSELKQRLKLLGEDLLLSGAAGLGIVSPFLGKVAIQEGSRAIQAGIEKGSKNLSEFFTSSKKQEGPVILEEIGRPKLEKIKATEPLARAKDSYERIDTTPIKELRTQLGTRFGIVDTKNISDTDVLSLHKELVRQDTGWYKIAGEDKWKREIDTSDLRINENAAEKMTQRVFPPGYKLQVIGFGDPKGMYTVKRNLEEKLSKNLKPVTKGFTPIKPEERELITSQFEDLINPDIAYRKPRLGTTSFKDFEGSQADRFTKAVEGFLSLREEGRRFKNKVPVFALLNKNNQIVPDTIEARGFTKYFAALSPEDTFNKSTFKREYEKHPLTRQAFQDYEKLKQKTRSVLAKEFINQDSEFAKLYPELMDYKVSFDPKLNAKGALARHSEAKREVSLSVNPLIFPETAKNLLIHELTGHGVQAFSGLIRGGDLTTVDTVKPLISKLERAAKRATSSAERTEALTKAEDFKGYIKAYDDIDRQLSLKSSYRMLIDDQLPSPQRTASLKQIDEEIDPLKKEKKVQAKLFYDNLLGEVEARLLQTRASLNKNQRKDLSPLLDVQGFILRSLKDQGYTMDRLGNITGQTMKEGKLPWNVNVAQSLVRKIRDAQFSGVMGTKSAFRPEFSNEIFKGEVPYEVVTDSIKAESVLKVGNIPFLQKDFRYDPSEPYFTRDVSLGEEIIYTDPRSALTEGAYIGERDLTTIPDNMKIDNITGKNLKDNLNEARIEADRISDLPKSQITEELKELGFKSLASMPDALKIKVLQEYKIRKPFDWHIGPDGMKRFEVSDKNTSLDKYLAKYLTENPDKDILTRDLLKGSPVLKMYPELGKTRVLYKPDLDAFGVLRGGEIAVKINPEKYPQTFKSIILHELGHETQDFMRFAGGGSFETAGNINKGLESIYGKINVLETRLNLNKFLEPSDSNRLAQLKTEAASAELLLKDWKKADLEFKKTGTKTAEEALEGASRKLYRALGGEIASRSIQRRKNLNAGERKILSPDINLGQIIVKELEDQGFTVKLPSFKPDLEDSLKVTITASDKSNFLPPHVKSLGKQLEEIIKAERTPLYRKSPFDREQAKARDKRNKLLKLQNRTDRQNAEIDELNDVLGVGETMNRADLRTRGEGYNKDELKIDLYGSDIPFDESIIKPELGGYLSSSLQAMEKSPNKQTLIKIQEQKAKDNVALYAKREGIGKQSGLQENAEAIQKAKDEAALGPLATLLKERNEIIKKDYPPTVFTEDNFPMLPLYQRTQNALDKLKRERIIDTGVDQLNENKSTLSLESGQKVDARLDIPSYQREGTWVPAIHPKNKKDNFSSGYPRTTQLRNVDFVQEGKSKTKALEVASGKKSKSPFATMTGNWVNHNSTELYKKAEKFLSDPNWTQIGYNPKRASYFYNTKTLKPVKSADEVIQIGQLVLAKNVKYDKNLAKDFNRGGIVSRGTRPTVFSTGIPTALRRETNAKI
tara:strand:- start:7539 stop:12524 length:4986 start_codon:yes stop_codon:yes gene_type:complete